MIANRFDYIEETKKSFSVLNPILSIFSLNCDKFQCKKYTVLSIVKFLLPVFIIGFIDVFTLYYKVLYTYSEVVISIKYTDCVQVVFDLFQYIIDLYVVYRCGISLEEYYKIYQKLDEYLGRKYCPSLKRKLQKIIVFYVFIWTTSCACDYCAWLISSGWETASMFSISYIFVLIKILTSLDMTLHLMHIDFRLRSIGDAAEVFSMKYRNEIPLHKETSAVRIISVENMCKRSDVKEIKWLCKCYAWVIDLTGFINQVFGTRVLLNTLSLLIDMVRFTNIAVRILLGSQHLHKNGSVVFPVISTMMRLFTCVSVVVSLANHCELTYRQRTRIVNIIDNAIIFKEPSEDVKSALIEFRGLIQSRPVEFCMSNLVRIDYSLLGSMASIVVTYTIILLQSVN